MLSVGGHKLGLICARASRTSHVFGRSELDCDELSGLTINGQEVGSNFAPASFKSYFTWEEGKMSSQAPALPNSTGWGAPTAKVSVGLLAAAGAAITTVLTFVIQYLVPERGSATQS
jgi:hypothetical protein